MRLALIGLLVGTAAIAQAPETEAPRSKLVGDVGALAIVDLIPGATMRGRGRPTFGGEVLLPGFTLYGQAGYRLTEGIAIIGAINGDFFFGQISSTQLIAIGPGIRFGDRHHFTLSGGAGFWRTEAARFEGTAEEQFRISTLNGDGVLGFVRAHMSVAIYRNLSLMFEAGTTFAGGVSLHAGAGIGGAFY